MSITDTAICTADHLTATVQAWSLDPRVVLRVVPGEGVYALRGETAALLRGAAYEAVAPLIDGRRSSDDVVDALTGSLPAAEVYFAIQGMQRRGYLVPAAAADQLAARAWWLEMGADSDTAARGMQSTVQIYATSGVDITRSSTLLQTVWRRPEHRCWSRPVHRGSTCNRRVCFWSLPATTPTGSWPRSIGNA